MIRIILYSSMLTLIGHIPSYGQLPSGRYEKKTEIRETVRETRAALGGIDIMAGYNKLSFLNPVYYNNIQNKAYIHTGGYAFGGRVNYYPLLVDVIYRRNYFAKTKINGVPEDEIILQRGYDISLAYAFMPWGKAIGKNFRINPYLGTGYQLSQLCYYCNQKEGDPDDLQVPKNARRTSNPFVKMGITLSYARFRLDTEYRRSINLKSVHAFNGWGLTIGMAIF